MLIQSDITPTAAPDTSVVYEDREKYARTTDVREVDATEDYIFLNHGTGVVSVFDWNGNYRFSIATTNEGNGRAQIFCVDNDLTIIDIHRHVFIYEGEKLVEDFKLEHEQYSDFLDSIRRSRNNFIELSGNKVLDMNGNVILTVHNEVWSPLTLALAWLIFILLFISAFRVHRDRRKTERRL